MATPPDGTAVMDAVAVALPSPVPAPVVVAPPDDPQLVSPRQTDAPPPPSAEVPADSTAQPSQQQTATVDGFLSQSPPQALQWGSFIKRAVSTVEQRLDKVLDPALATDAQNLVPTIPAVDRSGQRISMQQRLALAMQAQKLSSTPPSRPGSVPLPAAQPRSSEFEQSPRLSNDEPRTRLSVEVERELENVLPPKINVVKAQESAEAVVVDASVPPSERTSIESAADLQIQSLQADLSQRHQDYHSSLDRINLLEEKVKYLSNQLLDYSTQKLSNNVDKRITERDEKIALLIQEGESLSKLELKSMTTIKRLRAAERENDKTVQDARKKQERAEKEAADLREKMRKAAESEKKAMERVKSLAKIEADAELVRRERDSLKATNAQLREDVARANALAEQAILKAQDEAFEKEKARANDLEQQLDALRAEQAMDREKFSHEQFNLRSKLDRDADRFKSREHDLLDEISGLERKLENLRIQTEELSAGATGDSQAKMLRQVETLQSQYAVATENWQGIETTLLTRISGLERDIEERVKRETTLRRKAHDEVVRVRNLEQELETSRSRIDEVEAELQLQVELVASLRKRIDDDSARFTAAMTDLEKEKVDLEQRFQEEERVRREDTLSQIRSPAAPASPVFTKRGGAFDVFAGFTRTVSRSSSYSQESHVSSNGTGGSTVAKSIQHRRNPRHHKISTSSGASTPLSPSLNPSVISLPLPEAEAQVYPQQINMSSASFTGGLIDTGSLAGGSNGGDEISSNASTAVGGGASSSERMSSVIRRLSSELASAKEELAILSRDRDQAREEIVELLREVKNKRDVDSESTELKKQIEEMRVREQTTLELLGEKTERVNELQDDVQDLKQMYRQQIQELIEKINEK
ncbi:TATA element modulatory factor 1 TATA binding-domain-containing protein [Limtongia smithiae]|uniref:TATA element modulatory factor 1 TATA binding-domain-containing protein n=1 Tax=Limtongia smithiae TaxID=1125753 RepID=UPI0034CF480B